MSVLCSMFGHRPPESYSQFAGMGGGDYLTTHKPHIDGIGRAHFALHGMCPRCGERYKVGMIHGQRIVELMPTEKESSDE